MKQKFEFTYHKYTTIKELPEDYQKLLQFAKNACGNAYAPYSNFKVGAAVWLENGEIVLGSNQENAAYPSGLCAERVALFHANSRFPEVAVKALAIAARNNAGFIAAPVAPCGACRQVMLETEVRFSSKMEVILYGDDTIYVVPETKDLLPFSFDASQL